MTNISKWSVVSNWKEKSNKYGRYKVENLINDEIESSLDDLDYSEGCVDEEKELLVNDISFTARATEKGSGVEYVVTYAFSANVFYSYEAYAEPAHREEWGYVNDCHGEMSYFDMLTSVEDNTEGVYYGEEPKYAVTNVELIYTGKKTSEVSAILKKGIEEMNNKPLEERVKLLKEKELALKAEIPCEGFYYTSKQKINFLDFVFNASVGDDLYVYEEV